MQLVSSLRAPCPKKCSLCMAYIASVCVAYVWVHILYVLHIAHIALMFRPCSSIYILDMELTPHATILSLSGKKTSLILVFVKPGRIFGVTRRDNMRFVLRLFSHYFSWCISLEPVPETCFSSSTFSVTRATFLFS